MRSASEGVERRWRRSLGPIFINQPFNMTFKPLPIIMAAAAMLSLGCEDTSQSNQLTVQPAAAKPDSDIPDQVSYNRDIRPILSDKCFACHGPDRAARAADLRLDVFKDDPDGIYIATEFVVEPGNPGGSDLIKRIRSKKSSFVMPPPEFKISLTEEEKELISRWIEQGAEYEPHWAFVAPPKQIDPPAVKNQKWVRDELDRFVLARLEQEGMKPSEEASRERWLRRVSYTLTGLPPSPAEIDAFVSDQHEDAYERVVDRLLASPAYGERMAVPWLDLARYADTYGFSVDGYRDSWPWRDWVVQAFNENLPYDQFLTWQIAGDLLDEPTRDQRLATAFNRLHRMNAEGGAIPEEWRNEAVADRLHTFGTAFTGMTLECARCHDHRYDPISHDEYYELFAFFNSIDESGTTEFQRSDIIPPPSMLLPTEAQTQELERLRNEVVRAEKALGKLESQRIQAFSDWLAAAPDSLEITDSVGDFGFDALEGNKLANRSTAKKTGQVGSVESPTPPTLVKGVSGKALRFDGDNYAFLPGMADIDRWTPFTISLWMKVDSLDEGKPRVIAKRTSGTDVGPYGFDLMLSGGAIMARAYRHWPGNAIGVQTGEVVKPNEWVHIVWRYDGSSRADGLSLSINGKPADLEVLRDGPLKKTVGGGRPFGAGAKELIIGQRFRDRGLSGGVVDEVKLIRRAVSDVEAEHLFDGQALTKALAGDQTQLREYYGSAIDEELRKARTDLANKRKAFVHYENKIPEIAVMQDMAEPRPTHVLARGVYDAERTDKNRVSRDVPEAIMPWDNNLPKNRLGLAKWLTHPDHPLTSRIAVNRLWQICFGEGIVATEDNFGLQGALPTHPELLDYLARAYIESGWDTKAMMKRIVLSATYRQDSATTEQQWRDDPDNALLARGPARRLDAEMIRDMALEASGLLVAKQGGPPVYPYQPPGLWKEVSSASYRVGKGESLYRRSLYTIWKRAVPMPNMMAFDTPTREACAADRSPTNTPLQALVLLNDEQFIEAARVLAQRVMNEEKGDAKQIELGFRLLVGRAPTPSEFSVLQDQLNQQRAVFKDKPEEAKKMLAVGKSPRDEKLDPIEHAAMAVTMHVILNTDLAIWVR